MHACLRGFPAAALELSADGTVLDSNGRLEELVGRPVVGLSFADVLDAGSRKKWESLLATRGSENAGIWELVLERKGTLDVRTFAVVWGRENDEELLWLLEYARDLRLEPMYEELSSANSELVGMQRELIRARARAERAVRLRDEVLAVVAHDLKNPIARVAMAAQMLAEENMSAESRAQLLDVLQRSGRLMNRLVRDLLDVASIDEGKLSLDRREIDLVSLTEDVVDSFSGIAGQRGVDLSCASSAPAIQMSADLDRLQQLLGNLLDNAVRLTPKGGSVRVSVERTPEGARISVKDTGPGIVAEDLPHLFDRFWQGARSRRGSAGLGLAIAKGIVDAHGGQLRVESTAGQGTTFHVELRAL